LLKPVKTMEGFKRKTKQYILTLTYFFWNNQCKSFLQNVH
jgi:hypothetical protein